MSVFITSFSLQLTLYFWRFHDERKVRFRLADHSNLADPLYFDACLPSDRAAYWTINGLNSRRERHSSKASVFLLFHHRYPSSRFLQHLPSRAPLSLSTRACAEQCPSACRHRSPLRRIAHSAKSQMWPSSYQVPSRVSPGGSSCSEGRYLGGFGRAGCKSRLGFGPVWVWLPSNALGIATLMDLTCWAQASVWDESPKTRCPMEPSVFFRSLLLFLIVADSRLARSMSRGCTSLSIFVDTCANHILVKATLSEILR
jgi:hypothetical protein